MFIVLIMITGAAYAVNFVKEYDTNAPIPDDEWIQYRWQGEWTDGRFGGAGAVAGATYKWGSAISIPPGGTVWYNLIYPPAPGALYHVKHGVYRLFFYADTTNGGVQSQVDIQVYVDNMMIQIDTSTQIPDPSSGTTGIQSPAANGHCGVIDVGWIDFSDENHTMNPGPWHFIEIINIDAHAPPRTIIIDEIVISTAN